MKFLFAVTLCVGLASVAYAQNWPSFRGQNSAADDNSKHSFRVYCLDKNTGRIIWEKTIYEGVPKVKRHVKATYANPTPARMEMYSLSKPGRRLSCWREMRWQKW